MKYFITTLVSALSIGAFAQVADFGIHFKKDGEQLRLICQEGCNYNELRYELSDFKTPKYFNENGETNADDLSGAYLISIQQEEEGLYKIEGLKDTAWESYLFKTSGFWANFLLTGNEMLSL